MSTTQVKNGWHGGSDDQLLVNPDGSINVNTTGGGGSNASVGPTGTTAPTSATEIGAVDASGNLQHLLVDPAGKLLVDISGTSVITGTVNANIEGLNSFSTTQYVIGTSAVHIIAPAGTSVISVKAKTTSGSDAVVVGNSSSVTNVIDGTGNGFFLFSGDAIEVDITNTPSVWAIGTSAGQIICVAFAGT